jgi:endogenous inhibitor of DNA gyrase (YacG/DUF329 family)
MFEHGAFDSERGAASGDGMFDAAGDAALDPAGSEKPHAANRAVSRGVSEGTRNATGAKKSEAAGEEFGDTNRNAEGSEMTRDDDAEARGQARTLTLQLPASWLGRDAVQHLIDKPPTRCRVTGTWVSPLAKTWPFANAKAQSADLYGWLSGGYRIARDVRGEDEGSEGKQRV